MEQQIKDVVNFGIGAVKTLGEQGQDLIKNAEATLTDIATKGDSATDSASTKVKEYAQEAIKTIQDWQVKAEEFGTQVKTQIDSFDLPFGAKKEEPKAEAVA